MFSFILKHELFKFKFLPLCFPFTKGLFTPSERVADSIAAMLGKEYIDLNGAIHTQRCHFCYNKNVFIYLKLIILMLYP